MQYSKLEPDEQSFLERVPDVLDILTSDEVPAFNDECVDCQFVIKQSQ